MDHTSSSVLSTPSFVKGFKAHDPQAQALKLRSKPRKHLAHRKEAAARHPRITALNFDGADGVSLLDPYASSGFNPVAPVLSEADGTPNAKHFGICRNLLDFASKG